jgi:hypothetical protein
MPLFEVAVMRKPSTEKKHKEDGTDTEKLVYGPKYVVADEAQQAAMKTVMENAVEIGEAVAFERMAVLVRPFA